MFIGKDHLFTSSPPVLLTRFKRDILSTPFTPFFVLFCYVIESSSHDDLKILQEFVHSLYAARDSSDSVTKLYRLCKVMCDVAVSYTEIKSKQQQDQNLISINNEFEMYLSQLGSMTSEDQTLAHTINSGDSMEVNFQANQIGDWFLGNRDMIGLLEEDLSQIDSSWWTQPGST
jgi:hypothetical protein